MTGRDSKDNLYLSDQYSQRYFVPQEVAEVVSFVISDEASCISGEVINCDLGQYNSSYL